MISESDVGYVADPERPGTSYPRGSLSGLKVRLAQAEAKVERVEAALNERVAPTLGTTKWAADPLPSCPNYAHVNPAWLLELIAEAEAVRVALSDAAAPRTDGDTR